MDREVEVIDESTSYDTFLDQFLRPSKPCIITGLAKSWPATREWTFLDENNGKLAPNFAKLNELFGSCIGTITLCNQNNTQKDCLIRDFLEKLSCSSGELDTANGEYLKDFHFMQHLLPESPAPYSVPIYFKGTTTNERLKA